MDDAKPADLALAEQLRAAIAGSGETLYALAKRAGISYGVLHRFVAGKRDVTLATAAALAKALGLSFADAATAKKRRWPPRERAAVASGMIERFFDGAVDQVVASAFALRPPTAAEIAKLEALVAQAKRKRQ